jgi:hypothetical protein
MLLAVDDTHAEEIVRNLAVATVCFLTVCDVVDVFRRAEMFER